MKKIDLKEIMRGLQAQMDAKLSLSRKTLSHPVTVGDYSELEWLGLLSEYLPKRYCVDKGFVVDSKGSVSDQIDIIVFDRQYTPFVFHQNGAKYIPAEAVYAIIECKQDISPANLKYAARKAKSVRLLRRTSVPIVHAGGTYPAKSHHNILSGLICVGGKLTVPSKALLENLPESECLNFICSLNGTYCRIESFNLWKKNVRPYKLTILMSGLSLVTFVMTLIDDLQAVGTVPAMDIKKYIPKP